MDKADVFELIVRTFGIIVALRAAQNLASAVLCSVGAMKPPAGFTWKDYLIAAVPTLIVAVALLVWAPSITGLFYP